MDTPHTWELVLPALQRRHEMLALALAGHAAGPPLEAPVNGGVLADAVERETDAMGVVTVHLVGNSLGGYVALQLAARGRAKSVVALAPAGGWAAGDESYDVTLGLQESIRAAAPGSGWGSAAMRPRSYGRRRPARGRGGFFGPFPYSSRRTRGGTAPRRSGTAWGATLVAPLRRPGFRPASQARAGEARVTPRQALRSAAAAASRGRSRGAGSATCPRRAA